jgi:hypothetical protein
LTGSPKVARGTCRCSLGALQAACAAARVIFHAECPPRVVARIQRCPNQKCCAAPRELCANAVKLQRWRQHFSGLLRARHESACAARNAGPSPRVRDIDGGSLAVAPGGQTALVKNSVELRKFWVRKQPAVREGGVRSAAMARAVFPSKRKGRRPALSNGTCMRVDAAADGSLTMPAIPAVARQALRCAGVVQTEAA